MATYKAELHPTKKADGTHLIMLRITKNRKLTRMSTGYYVKPKDWNTKGEVRITCRMSSVYNSGIEKLIRNCQEEETKSLLKNTRTTGKQIKQKIKGSTTIFKDAALHYIESKAGRLSPRTIQRYKDHLSIFADFAGNIEADLITKDTIKKYEIFAMKGRSENTVHRGIMTLSEIWNHLAEMEMVSGSNPFRKTTLKAHKAEKQRLTVEELEIIRTFPLIGVQAIARDVFMLQYYLGGLRISDVLTLKSESIQSSRIEFSDMKTGRHQSHIIPKQAEEILNRYTTSKLGYAIPLITIPDTNDKFLKHIESKTATVNDSLREIVKKAKINKRISSHVARHSFADHLRQSDASIYTISKALGHSSIKMTENYLESFDTKAVDEAVRKIFK